VEPGVPQGLGTEGVGDYYQGSEMASGRKLTRAPFQLPNHYLVNLPKLHRTGSHPVERRNVPGTCIGRCALPQLQQPDFGPSLARVAGGRKLSSRSDQAART